MLGRSILRWKDVIKKVLHAEECGIMDWIELDQDKDGIRALVNAVMKLPVPYNAWNFLTS